MAPCRVLSVGEKDEGVAGALLAQVMMALASGQLGIIARADMLKCKAKGEGP